MRTSVGNVTHEIPVIDIGPFLTGGDGQAAADAIEAAATQVGFFQVINHGVPGELLDAVYAAAYALSDLPALRRMGLESFRIVAEEVNVERMAQEFCKAIRWVRGEAENAKRET